MRGYVVNQLLEPDLLFLSYGSFWFLYEKKQHKYKKTLKIFSSKKPKDSVITRKYQKVQFQALWLQICNKIYLTKAKSRNLSM